MQKDTPIIGNSVNATDARAEVKTRAYPSRPRATWKGADRSYRSTSLVRTFSVVHAKQASSYKYRTQQGHAVLLEMHTTVSYSVELDGHYNHPPSAAKIISNSSSI